MGSGNIVLLFTIHRHLTSYLDDKGVEQGCAPHAPYSSMIISEPLPDQKLDLLNTRTF
jgi:hypothetical protein